MNIPSNFNEAGQKYAQPSDTQMVTINKLQQAIFRQDATTLKRILDSGIDLGDPKQVGLDPLAYALICDARQSANILIDDYNINPHPAYLHCMGLQYVTPLDYLLAKCPPSAETCEAMFFEALFKKNKTSLIALQERKLLRNLVTTDEKFLEVSRKTTGLLLDVTKANERFLEIAGKTAAAATVDIKDFAFSLLCMARENRLKEEQDLQDRIKAQYAEQVLTKAAAKNPMRLRHRPKRTP